MASKCTGDTLPASPKWTRPSDVMKLRQLKRRIKTPGSKSSPVVAPATAALGGGVDLEKENDGDDDDNDEDEAETDGRTPTKRLKKNPFSVSPRRKLTLNQRKAPKKEAAAMSASSSASFTTKESLMASLGFGKKLPKKSDSRGDEHEALASPLPHDVPASAPRPPLQQQQHQQQQQQSFLDLISSISEESVDNTELFQRHSQRQRKSTPVLGGVVTDSGFESSQSAPSSANSSFNLSNLNLSSSSSSSTAFGNR